MTLPSQTRRVPFRLWVREVLSDSLFALFNACIVMETLDRESLVPGFEVLGMAHFSPLLAPCILTTEKYIPSRKQLMTWMEILRWSVHSQQQEKFNATESGGSTANMPALLPPK